jgi:repressor of nif and glnA expression
MRKHAGWLSQSDERILEFLRERGNHPPSAIRDNLEEESAEMNYNAAHIRRECRKLEDRGLLVNVGGGTYSITDEGIAFLEGELDAATLPDETE